jgi:DNA-binding FrmR family transcriptional regulator
MADKKEKCCGKKTVRSAEEVSKLRARLNRIQGQLNGIGGMLEKDAYCPDILVQISACQSAINSFAKEFIASHIKTCVVDGIRNGDEEIVDELVSLLKKLMR